MLKHGWTSKVVVSAGPIGIGMLRLLIDRDSLKRIGKPIEMMELMLRSGRENSESAISILGGLP